MKPLSAGDLIVGDLFFPESLRWHEGELWFSDVFGRTVSRLGPSGVDVVARVPGMPSGLGWTADGDLLVVSMTQRAVLVVRGTSEPQVYADLSGVIGQLANDMVVDSAGRAYVGNYGYDVDAGAPQEPTRLVRVDPDRSLHVEEPELVFPNGMVLVDDETRLVVAETFADRLTSCRVDEDGRLTDARVLLQLPQGSGPDGIAADSTGRIWVPCAYGSSIVVMAPDGTIEATIPGDGDCVTCCAVGGTDGRTLFVALAPMDEAEAASSPAGRIVALSL